MQPNVPLVVEFRKVELFVCPMDPVCDPQPPIAGVELHVVEIMELQGEGEGEVVARVVVHHLQRDHAEPEPGSWDSATHQDNSIAD